MVDVRTESCDPEEFDREHCMRRLANEPFGRILYTAGALPVIQPVIYALDGESIVIRTDHLSKLAVAGRQEVVAFEIDDIDPARGTGWSVVVNGRASEITSDAELARARELPLPGWARQGPGRYIRIACELVTGRRLGCPASYDPDPHEEALSAQGTSA